jgi:RHH-type proline utilization regulon transcriptional repressor/proline dehydrogenase/delta 1-pyrroline-5-carboxylate dehydrogenase
MSDPVFRARLFRFVDAFPALSNDTDIETHLHDEFSGVAVPAWFGTGVALAERVPGGAHVSAAIARRIIDRMARQFIAGTTPEELAATVGALWLRHTATTVDLLGEHTHSAPEADRYAERLAHLVDILATAAVRWPADAHLESDDLGVLPRCSVSVKVTALAPSFSPLTAEAGLAEAEGRLVPILQAAASRGVSVWFDMERYEVKELTHRLFRRLLERPDLSSLHAGIVVQAYLRDAADDLADLARWAANRPVPPAVRLVKGAYWDTETIDAAAKGWPAPVFERKVETDANYERLAGVLHEHHGVLRAAFGSHNLRSLAAAVVKARSQGIPDNGYELQLLYGMAEPVHEAIRRTGLRLRVYAPTGELVPGMAYLVRRLLENTSNESFVRHHFVEGEDIGELVAAPASGPLPGIPPLAHREETDPRVPGPYRPEPPAEWRRRPVLRTFSALMAAEGRHEVRHIPAVIGGAPVRTGHTFLSVDPAVPEEVVAEVSACGPGEVAEAVHEARAAAKRWASVPASDRAAVLFRAAQHLRSHRFDIAALEVREAGKGWGEADGDVCEAIDYCEYYGRRMLELEAGGAVQSPPGEENRLVYRGRGVAGVIAPWNFPLAIPAGMTAAALVAGNAVVLKPAEQTPAVAAELVAAFSAAGLPPGVLQFLPGSGEDVGAPLVEDPGVDIIAFTGSRAVGLGILEVAGRRNPLRRSIPRVITELGGKNAIIVDADADLDEVVPAVLSSAFGFAGQKCSAASRLICVEGVHDALLSRVVAATRSLVVAPPRCAGSQIGPVIDAESFERLRGAIDRAGEVGRVVLARSDVPEAGWFVGPAIVADVDPESWLARDELFGPVLAVFCVPDLAAALALANDSDYALTAGIFSRSPEHVRIATGALRAGNIYVNRGITGAVVGRQPFGGAGLSGGGVKAGGPDYLLSFCDPQVVSENTLRQGFAATNDEPARPSGSRGTTTSNRRHRRDHGAA